MSKTAKVLDFLYYKLPSFVIIVRIDLMDWKMSLGFQFSSRGDIPTNHFKSLPKARGSSVLCSISATVKAR